VTATMVLKLREECARGCLMWLMRMVKGSSKGKSIVAHVSMLVPGAATRHIPCAGMDLGVRQIVRTMPHKLRMG